MNGSPRSRLSGFHRLDVNRRIDELEKRAYLAPADANALRAGRQVLSVAAAKTMVENVVGVFGLPLAIAPNFVVNDRECIVPLVVEEPSIVAALSSAAALARHGGGFTVRSGESLLAGQIHIVGITDSDAACAALTAARDELIAEADKVHPRLAKRGGGVRDIELRTLSLDDGAPLIALHVLVDTCDAMGANLVNSICESIAPTVARISGGKVLLRILSNLADRSVVNASVRYPCSKLNTDAMDGEEVRDRIVMANRIALVDPHRAATHNKGIMNGIDALAIATGNDWRALEAGVHAYAARDGIYSAVTRWSIDENGDLLGEIIIPIKVGVVGGTLAVNDAARLGLAIAGVESARELAELMAAVGLAQNFSALRALVSSGIQEGHMRMHARSVASAAGATADCLDEVAERMIESGDVKDWKAAEILAEMNTTASSPDAVTATAAGKVILFGEHAVVYGRHALAVPISAAVKASVSVAEDRTSLYVPEWGLRIDDVHTSDDGAASAVKLIIKKLQLADSRFTISVSSSLPRGMGLGSSAAIAVAITRALAKSMQVEVSDSAINEIAFECEKIAHDTPSGIDNSVSCFDKAMLFRNTEPPDIRDFIVDSALPIVIGFSQSPGSTREQVLAVKSRRDKSPERYDAIFDQINELSIDGAKALVNQDYPHLGQMMNVCHGLLNAIEVSTPDIENMIDIARRAGALGAKLTGAGGGGSIVALCPDVEDKVISALHQAGYRTLRAGPQGT